jgi:hypothetical protein
MTPIPSDHSPATSSALFEVYQLLSDKIDEKHNNIRATVERLGERFEGQLNSVRVAHQNVGDRVLTIENTHASEREERVRRAQEADRRVGVIATLVSMAVGICLWVLGKMFK